MTRLVGTSFSGSPIRDADTEAPTSTRLITNAAKDAAFINDILTGDNSPPAGTKHDHTGKQGSFYLGARLGFPIVNQVFPLYTYDLTLDTSGNSYVIVHPFYLPASEKSVSVRLRLSRPHSAPIFAKVMYLNSDFNTSAGTISRVRMTLLRGSAGVYYAEFHGLTDSDIYVMAIETKSENATFTGTWLESYQLYHPRIAPPGSNLMVISPDASNRVTVPSASSGGGTVMSPQTIHSEMVADGQPIHGWLTTKMARNLNALQEYITGAPAGGNSSLTLQSSGGHESVDPTTSAFHDHSQASNKSNEPSYIEMPIWAQAFGSIYNEGSRAGSTFAWLAPGLKTAGAYKTLCSAPLYMPDRPSTAGSTLLRASILVSATSNVWNTATNGQNPNGVTIEAKIECFSSGGSSAGSSTAQPERLGSTAFGEILVTDIPFHPDTYNKVVLSFKATNGPNTLSTAGADLSILGISLHFGA